MIETKQNFKTYKSIVMKRFLATLTLAAAFISFSSFSGGDEDTTPAAAAVKSFNSSFKNATEVKWQSADKFYKADFTLNGQFVSAYYDLDGKMMAITRNISSLQLPITLQASLKKSYDCYWISDLFELTNEEGTTYYITLENADTKLVLKSNSNSQWNTFKKQRKS